MSVQITIVGDTGAEAAGKLSDFIACLGARFTSVPVGVPTVTQAPVAEPEAPKTSGQKKQTLAPAAKQTPLEKEVDAAKAEKPAEPEKLAYDEAACRAGLQKLASVAKSKATGDEAAKGRSGVQAAQDICQQFNVKKVSDLKAEQHEAFCKAIEAAIVDLGK